MSLLKHVTRKKTAFKSRQKSSDQSLLYFDSK